MGKWARHDLEPPHYFDAIRAEPGVYAIYFDGRLAYIGQSNNLCLRISQHSIRFGYGKTIHWGKRHDAGLNCAIKVSYSKRFGDWAMRELRLIRRLQPYGNSVGIRIAKSRAA